jgi:hypothetical protein
MKFFWRGDIQVAILVLFAAVALSALAYGKIVEEELPDRALLSSFPNGAHRYALLTGSACVGETKTEMKFEDDEYEFTLKGNVRFKLWDRVFASSLDGFANFNSIGQLIGGAITIKNEKLFLRFGSININPVTLRLRAVYEGRPLDYSTQIPGPITLKENRDKTLRMEYLHFGKVMGSYQHLLDHPALRAFKVSSLELFGAETGPCAESTSALDLTSLTAFVGVLNRQ